MAQITHDIIEQAKDGDALALEDLIRAIQPRIYHTALRMLADPNAAQDATQDILIRIFTKLSTFQGQSRFETWATRVAVNHLLTAKKITAKDPGLSFAMFSDDLLNGLADDKTAAPEDHVMLNELRLRCTMAMLLCLDAPHRAAYVLGEILELDHTEAAEVLDIAPASYRKRLSRARLSVQDFTAATCGLANTAAPCSCRKRLPAAQAAGRIASTPSADLQDAPDFHAVKTQAAALESHLRCAKLQRATGPLHPMKDYAKAVLTLVNPPT